MAHRSFTTTVKSENIVRSDVVGEVRETQESHLSCENTGATRTLLTCTATAPINTTTITTTNTGQMNMVLQDPRLHRSFGGTSVVSESRVTPESMGLVERDFILRNLMHFLDSGTGVGGSDGLNGPSESREPNLAVETDPTPSVPSTLIASTYPSESSGTSKRLSNDILTRLHAVVNEAYEHAKNDEDLTAILNSLLAFKPAEKYRHISSTDKCASTLVGTPGNLDVRSEFDCRPFQGPKTPPSPNSKLREEAAVRSSQRSNDRRRSSETNRNSPLRSCACCCEEQNWPAKSVQRDRVYEETKACKRNIRHHRSPISREMFNTQEESLESSGDTDLLKFEEKQNKWNSDHSATSSQSRSGRSDRVHVFSRQDRPRDICVCTACVSITSDRHYSNSKEHNTADPRTNRSRKFSAQDDWSDLPYTEPSLRKASTCHRHNTNAIVRDSIRNNESFTSRASLEIPTKHESMVTNFQRLSKHTINIGHQRNSYRSRSRSPCLIPSETYRNQRLHKSNRSSSHYHEAPDKRAVDDEEAMEHDEYNDLDEYASRSMLMREEFERKHVRLRADQSRSHKPSDRTNASNLFHDTRSNYSRRSPDPRQCIKSRGHRVSRSGRQNYYYGPPSPYTIARSCKASSLVSESPTSPALTTYDQLNVMRQSEFGCLRTQSIGQLNQSPNCPNVTQPDSRIEQLARTEQLSTAYETLKNNTKLSSIVGNYHAKYKHTDSIGKQHVEHQSRSGPNGRDHKPLTSPNQTNTERIDSMELELQPIEFEANHEPGKIGVDNAPAPRSPSASSTHSSSSSSSNTSTSGTSDTGDSSSSSESSSAGSGTESDHSRAPSVNHATVTTVRHNTSAIDHECSPLICEKQVDINAQVVTNPEAVEHEEVTLTSPAEPTFQVTVDTALDDGQVPDTETEYSKLEFTQIAPKAHHESTDCTEEIENQVASTSDCEQLTCQVSPTSNQKPVSENEHISIDKLSHSTIPHIPSHAQVRHSDSLSPNVELLQAIESNKSSGRKRSEHKRKLLRKVDEKPEDRECLVARLVESIDPTAKTTEAHTSAEEEGEVISDGTSDVDEGLALNKSYPRHISHQRYDTQRQAHPCIRVKHHKSPEQSDSTGLREQDTYEKRNKSYRSNKSILNNLDAFKAPVAPKSIRHSRFETEHDNKDKNYFRNRIRSDRPREKAISTRSRASDRGISYEREIEFGRIQNIRSHWNHNRSDSRLSQTRGRYTKYVNPQTTRSRGIRRYGLNFDPRGQQRYLIRSRVVYRNQGPHSSRTTNRFVLTPTGFGKFTGQRRRFDLRDHKLSRMR